MRLGIIWFLCTARRQLCTLARYVSGEWKEGLSGRGTPTLGPLELTTTWLGDTVKGSVSFPQVRYFWKSVEGMIYTAPHMRK